LLTCQQVHQSDSFANDLDQRSDFPYRARPVPDGGQVLRAFSFALVVGIVVGTYSSFGIAAPLSSPGIAGEAKAWRQAPDPQPQQNRGSENVPGRLCFRLEEVASIVEEMVISSPNRRRTNKTWTVFLSMVFQVVFWGC